MNPEDYSTWLENQTEVVPAKNFESKSLEIVDSKKPKLCPSCKHLIMGYRIGYETDFKLDYCSQCSGVWFDRNEWQALVSCGLHDEFYKIFTTAWQNQLKKADRRAEFETMYQRKFGDDFEEIQRMRNWLDAHEERDAILAFLRSADPFS